MDAKLAKIYYSPQGYWKWVSAIKKLAEAAKVPENVVKQWLFKQALWHIYLPAPRHVTRPMLDICISLANLNVVPKELQTLSGL